MSFQFDELSNLPEVVQYGQEDEEASLQLTSGRGRELPKPEQARDFYRGDRASCRIGWTVFEDRKKCFLKETF